MTLVKNEPYDIFSLSIAKSQCIKRYCDVRVIYDMTDVTNFKIWFIYIGGGGLRY